MAISNRTAIQESPGGRNLYTPGKSHHGHAPPTKSAIDDTSFSISQYGGEDPRQAYSKVRERLMELEIEKEEQEKQLSMIKQLRQKERTEAHKQIDKVKEEGERVTD